MPNNWRSVKGEDLELPSRTDSAYEESEPPSNNIKLRKYIIFPTIGTILLLVSLTLNFYTISKLINQQKMINKHDKLIRKYHSRGKQRQKKDNFKEWDGWKLFIESKDF